MKLIQIISLVGQNVNGLAVDLRVRRANGSLIYDNQPDPIYSKLKSVEIRPDIDGNPWLYWYNEKIDENDYGYSGLLLTPICGGVHLDYFLEVDDSFEFQNVVDSIHLLL